MTFTLTRRSIVKSRRSQITVLAALLLLAGLIVYGMGVGSQSGVSKTAEGSLRTLNDHAAHRVERAGAMRRLIDEVYDAATDEGEEFVDDAVMDASLSTRVAEALGPEMPSVHQALGARTGGEPISEGTSTPLDLSSDRDLLTKLVVVYAELCKHEKSCAIVRAYNTVSTIANLEAAAVGAHSPFKMSETMADPARRSATIMAALHIGERHANNASTGPQSSQDANLTAAKRLLGVRSSNRHLDAEALADRLSTTLADSTPQQRADTLATMWASYPQTDETLKQIVRDVAWANLPAKAYPRGLGRADNLDSLTTQQQIAIQDWEETVDAGNEFKSLHGLVASGWFNDGYTAAHDVFGDLLR